LLPFETVLSALLQNVCFYKLNVFCLCKLYMLVICFFLYLYLSLLFFKNKQVTKKEIM
jgi:hypothetical protein